MPMTWQAWALLSATYAALTAIFAKVGVQNVDSDFATLVRSLVILMVVTGGPVALGALFSSHSSPSHADGPPRRAS